MIFLNCLNGFGLQFLNYEKSISNDFSKANMKVCTFESLRVHFGNFTNFICYLTISNLFFFFYYVFGAFTTCRGISRSVHAQGHASNALASRQRSCYK